MEAGTRKVVKAAGLIMVAMVISRILGYFRDVIVYTKFGQNAITDAYNTAFTIPDFLYMALVGGALSSAFIPVFTSMLATNRENEAWEVASIIFNIVMSLMVVGAVLGAIFTPQLIPLVAYDFTRDPSTMKLTVVLTRIMFIQAVLMGLNGIAMGILNSYKHFSTPAIGSVLYNLGPIVIGPLLLPLLPPQIAIAGFSIGVVVGAAANFIVQVPALIKIGLRYKPSFNYRHPGVKRISMLILPVLIGLSVNQINLLVSQNLASALPRGIITALRSAQRIQQMPIGIFAIAIAVAVFPTLTAHAAREERQEFKRAMSLGVRTILFITIPSAAGLMALGVPIVQFLFEHGQYSHRATLLTAQALFYYSIGLAAYSAQQLLNRVFYALQLPKIVVHASIITMVFNILLSLALIGPLRQSGLALAYSISGIFNMLLLLILLRKNIGTIDGTRLASSTVKILLASAALGMASYTVANLLTGIWGTESTLLQGLTLSVAITVGVVVYTALALAFKMEEAKMIFDLIKRRFRRRQEVSAD